MNPNAVAAPAPRLMQDVVPPYARALHRTQAVPVAAAPKAAPETAVASVPVATSESETIPVQQAQTPIEVATPQVEAAAVAEPATEQAPTSLAQEQVDAQPQVGQEVVHAAKPTINWLAISLAVVVAAALLFAAYSAFK